MIFNIRKVHLLVTNIFPIGAVDSETDDALMSICISEHFERVF